MTAAGQNTVQEPSYLFSSQGHQGSNVGPLIATQAVSLGSWLLMAAILVVAIYCAVSIAIAVHKV